MQAVPARATAINARRSIEIAAWFVISQRSTGSLLQVFGADGLLADMVDRVEYPSGRTYGKLQVKTGKDSKGTGFWAVVQSVLAAGFGVQSSANKERDFTRGKLQHFIVGGIIGTLVFMLLVWLLVKYLLSSG